MKPDVLVVWPTQPKAMAQLEATYALHHLWRAEDREALLAEVGPRVRAVVTIGERNAPIDRLPRLEIIACASVGYDFIDLDACRGRGIRVTNTPDVLTDDVADMALILMLGVLRRIVEGDRWVREGRWARDGAMPFGTAARGRRLGILGLGRIGRALARRAEPLGMAIAYHGRNRQADVTYPYYPDAVSLAEASDVLAVCAPGGPETRNLVNRAVLDALGPEGIVVNVGRGLIIDEEALVAALVESRIAGAGLDVFANEPHVPEALLRLDNVLLQPHAGSGTDATRDAMAQLVVDNLAAHFAGRPLLTPLV